MVGVELKQASTKKENRKFNLICKGARLGPLQFVDFFSFQYFKLFCLLLNLYIINFD